MTHLLGSRVLSLLLAFALALLVSASLQTANNLHDASEIPARLSSIVLASGTIFMFGFILASAVTTGSALFLKQRVPAAIFDAATVALVIFTPSAVNLLSPGGGLSDAWVGDCKAYADGSITACGEALRTASYVHNAVLSAVGATASLAASLLIWRASNWRV